MKDHITIAELEEMVGGKVEGIFPLSPEKRMPVTIETLTTDIDNFAAQKDNAWAVFNQAVGAEAYARHLRQLLSETPVADTKSEGTA